MKADWLIRGATVIDGTGAPGFVADVALAGERVLAMAPGLRVDAAEVIDASGLVVAPGFIDSHTHDDTAVCSLDAIRAKLLQGVTTVVAGNCGIGAAPLTRTDPPPPLDLLDKRWFRFATFAAFLAEVERVGPHLNVAYLVGHTVLRVQAMTDLQRAASPSETARMADMLAEALDAGAIGVSTGTYYPPARAADAYEIVSVCRGLDPKRHRLTVHLRDEGDGVMDALREADGIAARLKVPLVISHHKVAGLRNHGRSSETLAFIEAAARTRSICMDCYPYEASSTMLLPQFAQAAQRVLVSWSEPHPELSGQDLDAIALQWGVSRSEAVTRLSPGGGIYFLMDIADVRAILSHPLTIVASDGLPHDRNPHPRLWGTFPRVLGRLSRDAGWFPLETAVHKMTGLPASRFGLVDRGVLREASFADLVIFSAADVIDNANYASPLRPADGIVKVFVNGGLKVDGGRIQAMANGRVLRA